MRKPNPRIPILDSCFSSMIANRRIDSPIFRVKTKAHRLVAVVNKSTVPYSALVNKAVYSGIRTNDRIFEPKELIKNNRVFFARYLYFDSSSILEPLFSIAEK